MSEARRCDVCEKTSDQRAHIATERMLGTRHQFTYRECLHCGTLAIEHVPEELKGYYPATYPPFGAPVTARASTARLALVRPVMNAALRTAAGARLASTVGRAVGFRDAPWFALLGGWGVSTRSAVLDVGCGVGHRLRTFQSLGFTRLTGTDPYLPAAVGDDGSIAFHRGSIREIGGPFDVVMLHHSLEHMPDPAAIFADVAGVLSANGVVIVRVPLAGSYAWRTYGVDWVQLDAPRHLFLFTERSLRMLAARHGFVTEGVVYDSDSFQFWGSELYRRGVSLRDAVRADHPWADLFTAREIEGFDRHAEHLNAAGDGDQAAFAFRRLPGAGVSRAQSLSSATQT